MRTKNEVPKLRLSHEQDRRTHAHVQKTSLNSYIYDRITAN